MENDIAKYIEVLGFPQNKEVTVATINEQYRAIIEKENLINRTDNERLNKIREAKLFLIKNIDIVTQAMVSIAVVRATKMMQEEMYAEASSQYESISKYLPWGADISSAISADDCMRYGICSLLGGLRVKHSSSYLFAYGYGGRWVGANWIDCSDYKDFPKEWNIVKRNIGQLISEHPMIKAGIEKDCSKRLFDMYASAKTHILSMAEQEFRNQSSLKCQLISEPDLLIRYSGKANGFFKYNNQLFYIYDDGNDNLYPIYSVKITDEKIIMDFYKFSHFRRKLSGKLPKHCEFTIKIITEHFLQLSSIKGNASCGQCQIAEEKEKIDFKKYMIKPKMGVCKICGGNSVLGICFNFCRNHLEK